jgi:hypothetical protein
MKRHLSLLPLACLALALPLAAGPGPSASAAGQAPAAEAGWMSLFDGTSLKGWRGYKKEDASGTRWAVQDGMLTLPAKDRADTRGSRDIISTETFDRFELTWDWKVAPGGNSGVKYFVLEDRDSAIGHEYQLIDDARHADAKIGPHRQTAAFYDVLAASIPAETRLARVKPAGEWNTSSVRVDPGRGPAGARVSHVLNGLKLLDYELGSPELKAAIEKSKFKGIERFGTLQKGHILIQDHGDQVWYRNIRIRRLPGS